MVKGKAVWPVCCSRFLVRAYLHALLLNDGACGCVRELELPRLVGAAVSDPRELC